MKISLEGLLAQIRARELAISFVDSPELTDAMRNKGGRRTASKRAMLASIEERKMRCEQD